jgi:hypothetical protein
MNTICYKRSPIKRSDESLKRKLDALLRDIHANNVEMSQCRHLSTGLLVIPGTDDSNGTILDGERQRICLDCREVLEVLA